MPGHNVYYVNSKNQRFTLSGDDLTFLDVLPLYSFDWDYTTTNRPSGMGGTASGFSRFPREIALELRMRGRNREQFLSQMNTLAAVADVDALNETPGRLYVDGQYMAGFLAVSGSVSSNPRNANFAIQDIKFLSVEPYWCTEKIVRLYMAEDDPGTLDDTAKKFNLRNPYRYTRRAYTNIDLDNTHYAPAPMRFTISGPITNPAITIAGTVYQVNVTVLETEQLVIDQTTHEIYTINAVGTKTNVFNSRNKAYDIFKPLATGTSALTYSGEFNAQIAIIEQRSQLRWV